MKNLLKNKILLIIVGLAVVGGVAYLATKDSSDTSENNNVSTSNNTSNRGSLASPTENQEPVKQVKACEVLSLEEVQAVYPSKTFEVKENRNDEPNVFEALSACQYQQSNIDQIDAYFVDLEIRAKVSENEAKRIFESDKELVTERKVTDKSGIGTSAYYDVRPMTSGGPHLVFYKDNVYYKLRITTFAPNATSTAEAELVKMATSILN